MKTKEYKRKISKANSGKKNAMYNPDLSKDHRDKTRLVFGYKKWSLAVRERDNFTCQVCGLKTNKPGKLHAHHLESFDTNEELRTDIKNGITLCNSCHNSFHNRYKGQKTNKKQFIEFQAEKCL
jgi:5-methylcytosine-specific restriction endonuclease McrA